MNQNDKQSMSSVTTVKSKVKVVFLGQQSTGKTSILMRFLNGKFQQTQGPTVGIDFMGKNYSIYNHHLRLQLWDTAGQERFRSLIPSYLKDAMITLIVFDLTNQKSIDNIGEWIQLCQNNNNSRNIIVFLGNKNDLKDLREINQQQIKQKINKFIPNHQYFQVSAKTGYNIQQVFHYACSQFVKSVSNQNQLTFSTINQEMNKRFNSPTKTEFPQKNKQSQKKSNVKQKQNIKLNVKQKNVNKKNKKGCC